MKAEDLKLIVKEKYGAIANQSILLNHPSCCGTSVCFGELEFNMIGDEYKIIEGHHPEADLGLGCGIPTQFAGIKPGHHVLDLGSGAGNDCFVARSIVGETGKVTGLDFTGPMIVKANQNNQKKDKYLEIIEIHGFKNVSVHKLKEIPIPEKVIENYLSKVEITEFQNSGSGIFSITVSGYKYIIINNIVF